MSRKRFVAALSMRVVTEPSHGEKRDTISHDMLSFLEKHYIDVVLVPNCSSRIDDILADRAVEGVILSGGNNVGCLRGEKVASDDVSDERDVTETRLLAYATTRRLPVLAICRGMQMLNAYFGGQLVRDLKQATGQDHIAQKHSIHLEVGVMRSWHGNSDLEVNSFHGQGVTEEGLAPCLKIMGSSGLVIEAVRHEALPVVGIQWHPERPGSSEDLDNWIVRSFVSSYGDMR